MFENHTKKEKQNEPTQTQNPKLFIKFSQRLVFK